MKDGFRNREAALAAIAERSPGLKKPTLKRYSWSRLHADLLDDIRWPLVARRAQAPLPIVEALVVRLEIHASRGQPRGYVGDFNAEAMAVRWGVDVDMVMRVFGELERADIGWIDQEQVVTFWARNPDSDQDPTAAQRQANKRERDRELRRAILTGTAAPSAAAARRGRSLTPAERKANQRMREKLARAGVTDVTKSHETGVTGHASRDGLVTEKVQQTQPLGMSRRDSVTSRPEQSRVKEENVTGLGTNPTPIDPALFSDRAKALQWLKGDGEALITRRLGVLRHKGCQQIERWSTTAYHDVQALARIVYASLATNAQGEAFRELVTRQVARQATEMIAPALPLPPVPVRGGG